MAFNSSILPVLRIAEYKSAEAEGTELPIVMPMTALAFTTYNPNCPIKPTLRDDNEPVRSNRLYAWLAAMSYPTYTLHVPILEWIKATLNHVGGLDVSTFGVTGAVIAAVAIAAIADRADQWIDRPIRSWLGKRAAHVQSNAIIFPLLATPPS